MDGNKTHLCTQLQLRYTCGCVALIRYNTVWILMQNTNCAFGSGNVWFICIIIAKYQRVTNKYVSELEQFFSSIWFISLQNVWEICMLHWLTNQSHNWGKPLQINWWRKQKFDAALNPYCFFFFPPGNRWMRSSRCLHLCWHAVDVSRALVTDSSWRPSSSTGTRTAWAAICVAVGWERWVVGSTTSWEGNCVGEITSGWFSW